MGTWCWAGSSHAKALTWTMSSGGKTPGPARTRTFFQAGQALLEESFAPLTDDFPTGIQATGNLIIGPTLGGAKNHPGAENLKIWQRILCGPMLQFRSFLSREQDLERAVSWHASHPAKSTDRTQS
jgi:hypothetical protein